MTHDPEMPSALERLMAADGLDAGVRGVTEEGWREFVERTAETLDIGPGTRVFQVGCGAGAFLYPLYENGFVVGGLEPSEALVRLASEAMPDGQWSQGDPSSLDPGEPWEVVLACGAFTNFPDLDYARGVLARMAAKATHAIAILDVPDRGTGAETAGDQLVYDRQWMLRALVEVGASAIQIEDQRIDGDRRATPRFNVFARL